MKVIEKGDKLYYTRIFPTVGIYDVCDLTVRTVTDTYFVGMLNYCELTQEECFCVKTKEHPCYYINDDYTFKEDIPFFGFKKGTDSKEVFKWQNI